MYYACQYNTHMYQLSFSSSSNSWQAKKIYNNMIQFIKSSTIGKKKMYSIFKMKIFILNYAVKIYIEQYLN